MQRDVLIIFLSNQNSFFFIAFQPTIPFFNISSSSSSNDDCSCTAGSMVVNGIGTSGADWA